MYQLINWIKHNKLATLLLLVIVFFISKNYFGVNYSRLSLPSSTSSRSSMGMNAGISNLAMPSYDSYAISEKASPDFMPSPMEPAIPVQSPNRMVVQDTYLSVLVKDVTDSINQIQTATTNLGGYMVTSSLSRPEGAASGYITLRVPTEQRNKIIDQIRSIGVKVVSEQVSGQDVTDQYQDLNERLSILEKTKTKFEAIQNEASRVQDLLEVQRELVSLQSQIDSIIGQQKYLEQTAKLTKITVQLSTDELALPYAPDQAWRPQVVFKQAVRSLIGSLHNLGSWIIWLAVYAIVWIPTLIIFLIVRILYHRQRK